MSEENVELVRQALEALDRRDLTAWLGVHDENFEVVAIREWPETAMRGPAAAWDFYVKTSEPFQQMQLASNAKLVAAGANKVLVHHEHVVRGRASGADVEMNYWAVVMFREGKILRDQWFTDRAEALEAAGLSE
jgi:ketosteroid isomerase-like protein